MNKLNKLIKFENTPIEVQIINGVPMFELYAVGMALGQIKKNSAGTEYPAKDRIDKNIEKAEIKPCVRNVHKYITESQIYDLMLETRTDKCKAFRKWLTNEVLPELNKTGSYSIKRESEEPSSKKYPDNYKTLRGEMVMTLPEVEHYTGLKSYEIRRILKDKGVELFDYYHLDGELLREYKHENKCANKFACSVLVVTRDGLNLLADYTPGGQKTDSKPKEMYCLILEDAFMKEETERIKSMLTAVGVMLDRCNKHNIEEDEMAIRRKVLLDMTSELASRVLSFGTHKLAVTDKYKT